MDDVAFEHYQVFGTLSRARGFTDAGVSLPITFEAIDRYADRFDVPDFEDFLTIVTGIDDTYLKAENDKRKKVKGQEKHKRARKGH